MNKHDSDEKQFVIHELPEYLHFIDVIEKENPSFGLFQSAGDRPFLFRGLTNTSYELLPGLFRMARYKNELRNKYPENEWGILQHFIIDGISYRSDIAFDDVFRWVQLAQHYGVPTRLLDWTWNPMVALYFSCEGNYNNDGCVWALHFNRYKDNFIKSTNAEKNPIETTEKLIKKELHGQNIQYPFIISPYYFDSRMSAQDSMFMVWGSERIKLEDILENERIPIVDYSNGFKSQLNGCMVKCIIDKGYKRIILNQLDKIGINEKSLFPGLDGIGRRIEAIYNIDRYHSEEGEKNGR